MFSCFFDEVAAEDRNQYADRKDPEIGKVCARCLRNKKLRKKEKRCVEDKHRSVDQSQSYGTGILRRELTDTGVVEHRSREEESGAKRDPFNRQIAGSIEVG